MGIHNIDLGVMPSSEPRRTQIEAMEAFYAADERRRRSPEADYGVHWRQGGQRLRVSYIRETGEVYAVGEYAPVRDVEVLAVVPADDVPEGEIYYRTLESLLVGWADECGRNRNGLLWLKERLQEYEVHP